MPNTYKSLGKAKRQQFLDSRARARKILFFVEKVNLQTVNTYTYVVELSLMTKIYQLESLRFVVSSTYKTTTTRKSEDLPY
ncbi:hypothetical protein Fleli_0402 [Bernardetia litoralis DSM 6794]|uniref:Uncharacterized protein n=1 Tax=Bernardetia litoralis (strain ATCC 23117 / DSM 6794 / NBRC 15988 / NCIMB 1366 / Fx l1 / Sio-4) TaxID=880071 RepID=I4AFZ3_BERLS|nr:hypothetical protein [Bernardetia litoralis]AFM02878.1 hypothetical protein Fleli_0402 [Bernardetia litoralis DSM 6794]